MKIPVCSDFPVLYAVVVVFVCLFFWSHQPQKNTNKLSTKEPGSKSGTTAISNPGTLWSRLVQAVTNNTIYLVHSS